LLISAMTEVEGSARDSAARKPKASFIFLISCSSLKIIAKNYTRSKISTDVPYKVTDSDGFANSVPKKTSGHGKQGIEKTRNHSIPCLARPRPARCEIPETAHPCARSSAHGRVRGTRNFPAAPRGPRVDVRASPSVRIPVSSPMTGIPPKLVTPPPFKDHRKTI
jgi:hypothetical protein